EIEQHANLPIDIQLSGHAHNGQIFPANFVVISARRLTGKSVFVLKNRRFGDQKVPQRIRFLLFR
ncbi:MAG: hypothetical protein ACFNWZ_04025, partial [Candidatus Absconditicoccaceae bacterium]